MGISHAFFRKSFSLGLCCRAEETLLCKSPHVELGRFCWLRSCIKHIFNENAIPGIRAVDEHMGHRTYQFSVLDDGAAAHE